MELSADERPAPATPGRPAAATPGDRLLSAAVLLVSLAVLLTGAWLTPSPAGIGSHEQLGLAPCGIVTTVGIPCATCGMTTAVSHAVHGQFLTALYVQPAGAAFALALAVFSLISGYALVTGLSLAPVWRGLWRPLPVLFAGSFVVAAWVYKIVLHLGT